MYAIKQLKHGFFVYRQIYPYSQLVSSTKIAHEADKIDSTFGTML